MAEIDLDKIDWDNCAHLAWNWDDSTPRKVCKTDHKPGSPCVWEIAEDQFQTKCSTCNEYLHGPQPSIGWCGAVWLCPTCKNVYYGFSVPEWGHIWYDGEWRLPEPPKPSPPTPQKAPHEKWLG